MAKTKSLIVRLPPELHKKMKLISVQNERSMNDYVVKALEEIVKKEEKKGKKL